ncbi:MAG TPA: hypothetical protein VGD52_03790 [Pseudoduganella sp.]
MKEQIKNDPGVIHVKVTVTKDTVSGTYEASYDPKVIQVFEENTILNFRLVAPTPDDIVIRSVSITPEDQSQLSAPSISKNGKQMTLSDINTLRQTFNLGFVFKDKHDHTLALKKPADEVVLYPEVDNNPPGMQAPTAMLYPEVDNNPPG